MKIKIKAVLSLALTIFGFFAYAADSKSSADDKSDKSDDLAASFRCEKITGTLTEMKIKMIDYCNLDKPFSSSMSRSMGGEEVYVYCCHKSK